MEKYVILLRGNQGETYRLQYSEGEESQVVKQIKELINNPIKGITSSAVIKQLMESAEMKSDRVTRKIGDLCKMILEEI